MWMPCEQEKLEQAERSYVRAAGKADAMWEACQLLDKQKTSDTVEWSEVRLTFLRAWGKAADESFEAGAAFHNLLKRKGELCVR